MSDRKHFTRCEGLQNKVRCRLEWRGGRLYALRNYFRFSGNTAFGDMALGGCGSRPNSDGTGHPKTQEKAGRGNRLFSRTGFISRLRGKKCPGWGFREGLRTLWKGAAGLEVSRDPAERGLGHRGPLRRAVGPAAPASSREGIALGFGEECDARAGPIDGDKSGLRVSKDDITQQPHAFHLELIGKPC